jgi:hypothetical protein
MGGGNFTDRAFKFKMDTQFLFMANDLSAGEKLSPTELFIQWSELLRLNISPNRFTATLPTEFNFKVASFNWRAGMRPPLDGYNH